MEYQHELFDNYNPSRSYILDITYTDVELCSIYEVYTGTEEQWIDLMLNYYEVFVEHTPSSFDEYIAIFKSWMIIGGTPIRINHTL